MKNIIVTIVALFGCLSCMDKEIEDIFEISPETRTENAIESMKESLIKSEFGWVGIYEYENLNRKKEFMFKFHNDSEVSISYTTLDGQIYTENSSYKLEYKQQLDLIFDGYSIFAASVDMGLLGEFRFELKYQAEDLVEFTGRNRFPIDGITKLTLHKLASQDEFKSHIQASQLLINNPSESFYRFFEYQGTQYLYLYDDGEIHLSWLENGLLKRYFTQSTLENNLCRLSEPIKLGNELLTCFKITEKGEVEAWSDTAKLGILIYGEKPFDYPFAKESFLAASRQGIYGVMSSCSKINALIVRTQKKDPLFETMGFYLNYVDPEDFTSLLPVNAFALIRSELPWFRYNVEYIFGTEEESDEVTIKFDRFKDRFPDHLYLPNYYEKTATELIDFFCNKTFSILPRGTMTYLIDKNDSKNWFLLQGY